MNAKPDLLAIGIFLWVAVTVIYIVITNIF
jgi:hypothetical protein